jgi:hypothetical protein
MKSIGALSSGKMLKEKDYGKPAISVLAAFIRLRAFTEMLEGTGRWKQ